MAIKKENFFTLTSIAKYTLNKTIRKRQPRTDAAHANKYFVYYFRIGRIIFADIRVLKMEGR
ncbi:MAG TPA: hypothetical protein DCG47_00660 [Spirochaetaceae bacterium]|nr:hypothetical protein [Spirochaetaceae bacterium]